MAVDGAAAADLQALRARQVRRARQALLDPPDHHLGVHHQAPAQGE